MGFLGGVFWVFLGGFFYFQPCLHGRQADSRLVVGFDVGVAVLGPVAGQVAGGCGTVGAAFRQAFKLCLQVKSGF